MNMQPQLAFDDLDRPPENLLLECVHCGLCLQVCPTYRTLGVESDSPRGRLYLMSEALQGKIELTRSFVDHMSLCLLCRACESTCPAGVKYGQLMENVRAQIRRKFKQPILERLARYIVFQIAFPHQGRLEFLFSFARFYQHSHLQSVIRRTGLIRLLPERMRVLDEYLPPVPSKYFRTTDHTITTAEGKKEHKVGFFSGCVMSITYSAVNEATLRVLAKNGCEILTPAQQRCCGALHVHNGELEIARKIARVNIDAFEDAGVEFIVSNSGGCGTTLKEYPELLKDDPQYANRAESFSKKVVDLSEFLTSIDLNKSFGRIDARATYQDSCHASHIRKISEQPRALIKSIPGIKFVEMKDADGCCASGGSYWFTKHDLSMKLLDSKMVNITNTKADLIVTANPPCMMQLQFGLAKSGINAEVIHLAELLDRAYRASQA